ncbi:MAG: 50S ribosomal protein L21 [Bdellovibrionales bacterium]|nr:50S ribosomal protein L21 [Bdellovibrionales bacterium]
MYAVVKVGNHQYVAQKGARISIEKLDGPEGSEVKFHDIVCVGEGETLKVGKDAKGLVTGTIVAQSKSKKIDVFKKKIRKGYRKLIGHRQAYTVVEITDIQGA